MNREPIVRIDIPPEESDRKLNREQILESTPGRPCLPGKSKPAVEIYELAEGVYAQLIPSEDGSTDAISEWIKANGRLCATAEDTCS